jgi:hemoglobin-like flavoprotein
MGLWTDGPLPTNVYDVYTKILGREPEPAGAAFWNNALSSGALQPQDLAKAIATAAANEPREGWIGTGVTEAAFKEAIRRGKEFLDHGCPGL